MKRIVRLAIPSFFLFQTLAVAQKPVLLQGYWIGGAPEGFSTVTGGACASSAPNPYPNPKLPILPVSSGCVVGTSLAEQRSLVSTGGPYTLTGNSVTQATLAYSPGIASPAALSNFFASAVGATNNDLHVTMDTLAAVAIYQEDIPATGGKIVFNFTVTASAGSYGVATVFVTLLSDGPTPVVNFSDTLVDNNGTAGAAVTKHIKVPPLMVGPSGTYTAFIEVSASAGGPGAATIFLSSDCVKPQVQLNTDKQSNSGQNTRIFARASFIAKSGGGTLTIPQAAAACGVKGFDWQQTITNAPCPSPFHAVSPSGVSFCPDSTGLTAPPPFNDPVPSGYTYCEPLFGEPCDYAPFYYLASEAVHEERTPTPAPGDCISNDKPCVPLVTADDKILAFHDAPSDPCLPGASLASKLVCALLSGSFDSAPPGSFTGFTTTLIGINEDNTPAMPLYEWSWTSTFNGTSGGIATTFNRESADASTGTGGIAVTSSAPVISTFLVPGAIALSVQGINSSGTISGYLVDSSNNSKGWKRTSDGTLSVYTDPADTASPTYTQAAQINDQGIVVGTVFDSVSGVYSGFLNNNGAFTTYNVPGQPAGTVTGLEGVNNNGAGGLPVQTCGIVGIAPSWQAFIASSSGAVDIFAVNGSSNSICYGLNNSGFAVGAYTDSLGNQRGFLRHPDGTIENIDYPRAAATPGAAPCVGGLISGTIAIGVNNNGEISGHFWDASHNQHGFIRFPDGSYKQIDVPNAYQTAGGGINDAGTVVGHYFDNLCHPSAYVANIPPNH